MNTDILLGLLKTMLRKNPDLKLMVMSATLEVESFCAFLETDSVVFIEGRQHAVEVDYCCCASSTKLCLEHRFITLTRPNQITWIQS
jgi:HrpA-like RNA helicase